MNDKTEGGKIMAYDGLFTKKIIESLQFLVTGRIHKINQPENDTIIMIIRQNRKTIIYCYLFIPIFQECISPIKVRQSL